MKNSQEKSIVDDIIVYGRDHKEHRILALEGDLDFNNVNELKDAIDDLLNDSHTTSLILDMKGINYMNSTSIATIVGAKKKAKNKNCQFALLDVTEEVLNIFKLASLDKIFTLYEGEDSIP